MHFNSGRKSMEPLCSGPSQTSLYVSLHLSRSNFFFLNNETVIAVQGLSLSSLSCSSKF